ncbi:MAG: hypothetical protein RL385_3269 [Pseudomonadota bacterium]
MPVSVFVGMSKPVRVTVGMVVGPATVGTGFWLEGLNIQPQPKPETPEHVVEDVIVEVHERPVPNFYRHMPISQVKGSAGQEACILRLRDGHGFRRGDDPYRLPAGG